MSDELHWKSLQLGPWIVPAGHVSHGSRVRLVMDGTTQYAFMDRFYPGERNADKEGWQIWLQTESATYRAGSPEFCMRVGSMIRSRGMIANLSLRENLLLPFLYDGDEARLAKAAEEVEAVAERVDLLPYLDEQAGERSSYTHALVSLGRCLLLKPDVIVAQEVHVGMSPERLQRFRDLAIEGLRSLDAGILYLTSTVFEGSGISFEQTLEPMRADPGMAEAA